MENGWKGLPYYPISEFYQNKFQGKVYKIPVSVVDDCPNRRGLKGMETCVFCDIWGSAAKSESVTMELSKQIEKYKIQIEKRVNAKKFLVYFQAYTNTFTKVNDLRLNFDTALSYPWVNGITIGTRPDCLSKAVIDLWNEYNQKTALFVELGVQSFNNDDLIWMKRGHTSEQSIAAIHKIKKETQVNLGVHLMFGLPNETDEEIIKSAEIINSLPVDNVKLHNLHVLKHTPLEKMYFNQEFTPIERDDYAKRVMIFLQHLNPAIAIHRLAALSSRWDELIAPLWTRDKMGTHQYIIDYLRAHKSYQGQFYKPKNQFEIDQLNLIKDRAIGDEALHEHSAKNLEIYKSKEIRFTE